MSERYFAVEDAAHSCCNGASVADREQPNKYNECGCSYICETADMIVAEKIAKTLNMADET